MRKNGNTKSRKIIAAIMTICMAAGLFTFNGWTADPAAAADAVTAESPTAAVYESDITKLADQWRHYSKVAYGLDGREWLVCGVQDDELILLCNPDNPYGQSVFGEEATSYETSEIDKTLVKLTQSGCGAFSDSEINLMKNVEVTLVGDYDNFDASKYRITRKLYAPYPKNDSVNIGKAVKNDMGDISVSLKDNQLKNASFWSRAVNKANVYRYENGAMVTGFKGDTSGIVPAVNLDISTGSAKPLFVSAAETAKADAAIASTAADPTPEDTTLFIRYDGTDKVGYSAKYNSKNIYVSSTGIAQNEYLYVQWSENNKNKVKSVKLEDCNIAKGKDLKFTVAEICGSGFGMSDNVKLWVEKKVDNLCYAREGTRTMEEGPEVPEDLVMTRSTNGESDGALSGLDPDVAYEYRLERKTQAEKTWTSLPMGSTEISGLPSGNYYIRAAETAKYTAGPEKMYRVKDIYDVTIDPDTNAVLVNEKDISTYDVFGSLSIDLSYSKDGVFSTLSKIKDVFDAETISGLVEKYVSGKSKEEFNTYKTVERLGKVSESLSELSAQTDGSTKEILGNIDSSELKKEWSNAENSFSSFQESYYDDFTDSRLKDINGFYNGEITDKDMTADIDSSLIYFYSDGNISQLTGEKDDMANGIKMYNDFAAFGDTLLNAAPQSSNEKDIFTLCNGTYSYLYNFNNETFSERNELYRKIFFFYEKGYSALASSLAYNISNHKDQLSRINDLRTAAVRAETSEESELIQNAIKTVAKETARVYDYDTGTFGWTELEKFHEEQIEKEKESLKKLTAQYEAIKAAYEKAEKNLQAEKEKYEIERIITCYRNQVKYNADLEILSVNDPYIDDMKSTKMSDFLKNKKRREALSVRYRFIGLAEKYKATDRTAEKATELVNDLKSFTEWAGDRKMTLDEQMGKAFCSDGKYSQALGFYVNGEQEFKEEEHIVENYGHFYRNVTYYKDGRTESFCSAHKSWSSIGSMVGKKYEERMKDNDVKSDTYVIHLNRVKETPGGGGGDECFMAKGRAVKSTNRISWNTVDGAKGYDVYFAKCEKSMKKVATTKKLSYTKKKLSRWANYTYKVKAYTRVNGKKKYIATTPAIHIAGVKTKHSNALSVKSSKDSLSLTTGSTAKITCKVSKKSSSRPVLWKHHVKSKIRYKSSDKSIVTVNSKGKVTGKSAGTAYIYGYAASGAYTCVEVTVEAD